MTEETRRAAEEILGHTFRDPELLEQALTHASVAETRLASNERLEFLGDSILGLIVSDFIFRDYPDLLEGEMTKIKSTAVSRQTCAVIARELGLDRLLSLGKGMMTHDQLPQSLAAAVVESVIAALYLDGGPQTADQFITPLIAPLIRRAAESGHQENFKSLLQHHAQEHFSDTPSYKILDEKGPDHSKCFKACVELAGRRFEPSWGPSKKQAEQQAALNALYELGVVGETSEGDVFVLANGGEQDAT